MFAHLRMTALTGSLLILLWAPSPLPAQSTEFTYQGKLSDGSVPAKGTYDFEFRLFSMQSGGAALGTLSKPNIDVTNGIFSIALDFGAQFGGSARWLEIAVRTSGSGAFTTLVPRDAITSTPYSIRSLTSASTDAFSTNPSNCTSGAAAGIAANGAAEGCISVT